VVGKIRENVFSAFDHFSKNQEMSGILIDVREMLGILLTVGKFQGKVAKTIYC